ncbi:MAG: hypothetical protein WA633_29460 [Stellaceae bacterium]
MRRQIGLLSIVGFFGLLAAADAQTTSSSTGSAVFDGTYRFVSSAKVNPMYTSNKGNMAPCPDRTPGPLTIVQGQAQYTTETGYQLQGTIGPDGELELRVMAIGGSRPMEIRTSAAQIDGTGTLRARQIGGACSYDFIWQKQST